MVIWPKEAATEDRFCSYISMGIQNGTLSEGMWISNDKEQAISYTESKERVQFSCKKELLLSTQGYALTRQDYIKAFGPSSGRSKRQET